MKKLSLFTILILMLAFSVSVVSAGDPNPGSGSVNFTVMNKDSVGSATVVVQYIDVNGNVAATKNASITPLSSEGFPISSSGLPDGFKGSAIISADKQVAAFAQMKWAGGQYGDGNTAGAYNGFGAGANKLYFPSLKARSTKQNSIISIQSADAASTSETITFNIKFYNRDGSLATTLSNQTVKKGTQVSYDLLDDINLPADWNGSAIAESTAMIAGVATTHWKEYSAAYSAVTGGGTTAYIPEARRRLRSGDFDQFTGIIVQNLDTTSAAAVTVKWYDRSGTLLHQFNDSIPANSSSGYNTRFGADIPDYSAFSAAVGDRWNGAVKIESTNGKEIVAVVNLQWIQGDAAATAYTSYAAGGERVLMPAAFRRQNGSSSWKQYTGIIVQNVGNATCTNFTVDWFDRNGNNMLSYTDTLAPGISHGYNTRYGADVPAGSNVSSLGSDFRGSVVINGTGCELVGIHNTVYPFVTDNTSYQGFND